MAWPVQETLSVLVESTNTREDLRTLTTLARLSGRTANNIILTAFCRGYYCLTLEMRLACGTSEATHAFHDGPGNGWEPLDC